MKKSNSDELVFPVLPLRDVIVFPNMVIPLFVGREKSIKSLEVAMEANKQIMLVAQKSADLDDPQDKDVYRFGTLATILQLLKLPDGTIKVLVEGANRAEIQGEIYGDSYYETKVQVIDESIFNDREIEILSRSVIDSFDQYVKLNKKIAPEVMTSLSGIDEPSRLADTIAAHMVLKLEEKQAILEINDVKKRIEHIISLIENELDILQVEKKIRGRVKNQMEKSQREYYLNEQMKAIQKELGDMDDIPNEIEEIEQKIIKSGMPKDVKQKIKGDVNKLKMMSPMSAEASVLRNYIDVLVNVPWKKRTKVTKNLVIAEKILEDDHHGLEKVKERILEYLAVQQRVRKLKGPILCLVGPPGVGKTSLGKSIAKATGRKFTRMSLGGVRDEAEIRGHRRTYIGSLPGKIMQNISKVGVRNPLFLLDEIDKMAMDFRGDPSSALLEVLDSEQNDTFSDHYLEVDFDLSDVMFVATANSMNIPSALLDRMEVIRIPGYTENEKDSIASKYLITKQLENNGLTDKDIKIDKKVFLEIIRYYTREAGVRNLEREISKFCRKAVKILLLNKKIKSININKNNLNEFLGIKRFKHGEAEKENVVGLVNGLAWTEAGGELLSVETAVIPGKGKYILTGKLGDVMQESIRAAMTIVRKRALQLGIDKDFYENKDIHVHFPEGATPKDGPSAGVGITTSLVSALTNNPVKSSVAMTGEVTLHGQVLPIGGLKEKMLAALRGGIKTVIIPQENEKDLAEIPDNIKNNLEIKTVEWVEEVLSLALERPITGLVLPQSKIPRKTESKDVLTH
ncbi:MAG: endopeptidase La [Gammaproteobacteria bacterium]|jgi:ATP-dependent Lon protease|nr:endopeptidase La [Gammaproteobacteria bacterium]MBT7603235.1 endopeptidase La [Gammaproteobacteria bacterium]